jgi:hypothetical protein
VSSQDKEPFLSRWSRRKLEPPREERAPQPAAPAAARPEAAAPAAAKPELPPVDSLRGLASEYKEFLRPGVDEKVRTAALKKLFRDPHFNVMDGLDVYMDDYSKPDPIPEAMLRTLQHARGLLFGDENKNPPAPADQPGEGSPAAAANSAPAQREAEAPAAPRAPEGKT